MKVLKEIYTSLKIRPIRTVYSLLLAPVFYVLAFLTCATLALIDLDVQSGKDLWDDII